MSKARITINPTSRCTLNCVYCQPPQEGHRTLTFDQIQNSLNFIAEQLPDVNDWDIHFNSHDVLLCWEDLIKPCIEYYDSNNTHFSLHTNGILLSEKKAKFLQEHNVSLMMSIDGPQHVQDINRKFKNNKSSYQFIMNRLTMLKNLNYPLQLVATFNDLSIPYIYDSYSYFIKQNYFFSFLFDIKYSQYDIEQLKSYFHKIAIDFAQQPEEKQNLFRVYYRSIHPNDINEYRLTINTNKINAMVNKHSFNGIAYFKNNEIYPIAEAMPLALTQGSRCAHNKITCLKCPAFHGEFSHFPKYNMEIYCLLLQELFSEIKNVKGENYFDSIKN